MRVVEVDDPADGRLADYVRLTDADLRRRHEAAAGVFVAEGELVIRQAVATGAVFRSLLVTPARLRALGDVIDRIGAPVYVAGRSVMAAVAGFDLHRGAVAAIERPQPAPLPQMLQAARRLLVLEDVNDAENMGSLFRNAAGLGADGVLLSPRCCDPLYRRSVRVSMGHVLTVPWARLASWPSALATLRGAGFSVVALSPKGACPLPAAGLAARARVALVVGTEGPGLTDAALAACHLTVAVPMAAGVDSLNVATAAAIALYAASPG